MKLAGPGISDLSGGPSHLKESPPLYDKIQRIARTLEAALREGDLVRGDSRTQPQLKPTGDRGLGTCGRTGLDHCLIKEILKLGSAHLVSDGIRIGQIVGDVVDIRLLGIHAARGAEKCSDHTYACLPLGLRRYTRHFLDSFAAQIGADLQRPLKCFKLAKYRDQLCR